MFAIGKALDAIGERRCAKGRMQPVIADAFCDCVIASAHQCRIFSEMLPQDTIGLFTQHLTANASRFRVRRRLWGM